MKHLMKVLILVVIANSVFGQVASNTRSSDSSNIYYQALDIYVKSMLNESHR